MARGNMELLRLGHVGLTAAEEGLLATLFRLHGIDRSFIWALAVEPPFDALLVDAQRPEIEFRHLRGQHTCIMRLDPHGEQTGGAMPRPIRSDLLLNWLNSIELGLLHSHGDAFASTAHHSEIEPPSAPPPLHVPAVPPVVVQVVAAPVAASLPPGWTQRDDNTEYRLKRWPPAALLNKDVSRVRVATMVSRRAMSLQEASDLSRIPAARCEEYLLEWARHGLVSLHNRPAEPLRIDEPERPDPTAHARANARHGFGTSLIRSIRKRFGIL